MLKYLIEHGAPFVKTSIIDNTISPVNDHELEIVKYLHGLGCTWKESTCASAANRGNLELLKYLHENGCPWDALVCVFAADRGHIHCLEYALEHGCKYMLNSYMIIIVLVV